MDSEEYAGESAVRVGNDGSIEFRISLPGMKPFGISMTPGEALEMAKQIILAHTSAMLHKQGRMN